MGVKHTRRQEPATGKSDRLRYDGGAPWCLEREANVFAAELLMPEPAVREAWEEVGGDGAADRRDEAIRRAAARFDISPSAMWWRLYSFGLVPTGPPATAEAR